MQALNAMNSGCIGHPRAILSADKLRLLFCCDCQAAHCLKKCSLCGQVKHATT